MFFFPGIICSLYVCSVAQSCLTLCDPVDCGPPGASVHGILQVKILEWVAIFSSRGASSPRESILVSCVSCIGRQTLCHWCPLGHRKNISFIGICLVVDFTNNLDSLLTLFSKGLFCFLLIAESTEVQPFSLFCTLKWELHI